MKRSSTKIVKIMPLGSEGASPEGLISFIEVYWEIIKNLLVKIHKRYSLDILYVT